MILYLDQEGRGLGLANKMRAYELQDEGLDTVDANITLGFDDDERDYGVAGRMLDLIGCARVKLMTNNPAKIEGLVEAGIEITDRVPLLDAGQRRQPPLSRGQGGAGRAQPRPSVRDPGGEGRVHHSRQGRCRVLICVRIDSLVTLGARAMASTYAIPVQAYTSTAKTLHWLTAALVLTIIPVGVGMTYLQGPLQDFLFHIHRSLGVTLIPLILYRLFYRLTHKPLPLPDDIEPMQKFVGRNGALAALRPSHRAADPRLDRDLGVSRAGAVFLDRPAAADLAGEPRFVRAAVLLSSVDRVRDRGPSLRAYRRRAVSLFHPQRSRASSHDQRMMVRHRRT